MAKVEEAARIGLAWHAALARHDADGMAALLGEGCVWESASPAPEGTRLTGRAVIASYLRAVFQVAPQITRRVEEVLGFGRYGMIYWREEGDNSTRRRGVDVFEVREGLVVGIKSYVKA